MSRSCSGTNCGVACPPAFVFVTVSYQRTPSFIGFIALVARNPLPRACRLRLSSNELRTRNHRHLWTLNFRAEQNLSDCLDCGSGRCRTRNLPTRFPLVLLPLLVKWFSVMEITPAAELRLPVVTKMPSPELPMKDEFCMVMSCS